MFKSVMAQGVGRKASRMLNICEIEIRKRDFPLSRVTGKS